MSDRLYLITPPAFDPPAFADALAAALDAGGVACVRLDLAAADADAIGRAVDALRPATEARDVALVIAEHVRLARALGLDGAHLHETTGAAAREARATLGDEAIVGVFAGASRHRGMVAAEAGADYVAMGPVRAGSLGDGTEADAALFAWWDEMIETPSVAEGGLTPEVARTLAPHADFLAPRMSVWGCPDGPAAAVRAYCAALAG